jgi:hypothetical protein
MKYKLLIHYSLYVLIILILGTKSFGQNEFSFQQNGIVKGNKPVIAENSGVAVVALKLDDKQKKNIKIELAQRVQQAIDNIQDDSLRLKSLYKMIWGESDYNNILNQMKCFKKYLLSDPTNTPNCSYTYVPDPSDMETYLFNASIYSLGQIDTGNSYTATPLIFTNPLNHYLLKYLQKTMEDDRINEEEMDIDYKKGWRELEESFVEGAKALDEIKVQLAPCSPTACTDNFDKLHIKLQQLLDIDKSGNKIIKLLKKDFFKKWLWYSQGYLFINPLAATTRNRRYPSLERISQLNEGSKKMLVDDSTEDALLKNLFETRKIKNEVLTPIKKEKDKVDFYVYDAAQKYTCLNEDDLSDYRDDKKDIGVIIYNVQAKETLKISLNKSITIRDQGSVIQNIEDGFGLTSILGNAAGWLTAWSKVSTSFNGFEALPAKNIIRYYNPDFSSVSVNLVTNKAVFKKDLNQSLKTEQFYNNMFLGQLNIEPSLGDTIKVKKDRLYEHFDFLARTNKPAEETKVTDTEFYVKVNGRKIAATKNSDIDKINFILASFIQNDVSLCNSCPPAIERCLIDTFIKRDYCYVFNYEHKDSLTKGSKLLLERFKCYINEINKCQSQLQDCYEAISTIYLPQLKNYLSIIQRSLPPVLTVAKNNSALYSEETINETSDYRKNYTVITPVNLLTVKILLIPIL